MVERTLLFVDDDRSALRAWERLLKDRCRVLVATDSATAYECVASEPVDLAVVDLVLKRESGIAVIERLKAAKHDLSIWLMTGYPSWHYADAALAAGAATVIEKPTELHTLRGCLLGERPVPAPIRPNPQPTAAEVKREYIARVVVDEGSVTGAARRLRIDRSTVQRQLKQKRQDV
jgi:two-component system response regulator RegA